jgi:hypothetical protein
VGVVAGDGSSTWVGIYLAISTVLMNIHCYMMPAVKSFMARESLIPKKTCNDGSITAFTQ